jgi:hypothetical protein
MATAARQRMFNAVFPPQAEALFGNGGGKFEEQLSSLQRRNWDIVQGRLKVIVDETVTNGKAGITGIAMEMMKLT